MRIYEVKENKEDYLDLLLIGDEDEHMVEKYLSRGYMFLLDDFGIKGLCLVTEEGKGIYEIKNLAVYSKYRKKGYGKSLVKFIVEHFKDYEEIYVGTGYGTSNVEYYKKLGFQTSHILKNFFLDNYSKPIYEDGIQLTDMQYLKMEKG
ncbi:GNAT family N-acetyltransferase [Anaerosphaera multitolerans]|uniref:N-acetyltransferase n=1 Tax=Anaerosphaera multitolerans TaxID=2487351 RepID=A0A437S6B0_9FIRM|nr:GNAT family N-acetyltransferase [Anaerosphaera multitolerans]RVU54527.1 N-acetyltransferase [Anaerosphaera multitolerans]